MIELEHGGGGFKNNELIKQLRQIINLKTEWTNTEDDAAIYDLGDKKLVFTTDAFIVDPIFFQAETLVKLLLAERLMIWLLWEQNRSAYL